MKSISRGGRSLRLVLERAGDRVQHRIEILDAQESALAELQSVEGTSADMNPPSPPLQNCSLEEIRAGEKAALLVGMAGTGHWSASIEAHSAQGMLIFDCACRIGKLPKWLGSTYRLAGVTADCLSLNTKGDLALINLRGAPVQLRAEQTTGALPSIQICEGGLEISCDVSGKLRGPATFRWRYSVSVVDGP